MLDDRVSPAVVRALRRALGRAKQRSSELVEPVDLLAGLLGDVDGLAVARLQELGTRVDDLRDGLRLTDDATPGHEEEPPLGPGEDADTPPDMPLDAAGREAYALARQWAVALGRHDRLGSEELLFALLETVDELRAEVAAHGCRVDEGIADFRSEHDAEPIDIEAATFRPRFAASTDAFDVARIVDASANRFREAVRVLEDFCRFALDDKRVTGELKSIRHELRFALEFLPAEWLVRSRDTLGDVGTTLSTPDEAIRPDLRSLIVANARRAEEALRTLEECAKLASGHAGEKIEALRYRFYTVERWLAMSLEARTKLAGCRLCWLADPRACVRSFDWMVERAISGGVGMIQLRAKTLPDRELLDVARRVREWTAGSGALFIVNDRPDIARIVEADGVHVGQDDLPVRAARRLLGPDAIVGVSTHDLGQALRAVGDGADYIGVGPVFASMTKQFDDLVGLDFVREIAREVRIPAFCIGGIDAENLPEVLAAGGRRVAVSSVLARWEDPRPTAASLAAMLAQAPVDDVRHSEEG